MTQAMYLRLRVPVSASNLAVIRSARRKVAAVYRKGRLVRFARGERHNFYRAMLRHHECAQHLCSMFLL